MEDVMRAYDAEELRKLQPHITLEEAAELLRISTKTLKRIIKKHGLETHRITGTKLVRIPKSELLKIIENG